MTYRELSYETVGDVGVITLDHQEARNALTATTYRGLLTELYRGLPLRTYIRTRAWSDADIDAAEARLVDRGLVDGGAFTDQGRAEREAVEVATDRQCRPIVEALGDDVDELLGMLEPWVQAIRDGRGYPASGPQRPGERRHPWEVLR
jgi:hypothetical protein